MDHSVYRTVYAENINLRTLANRRLQEFFDVTVGARTTINIILYAAPWNPASGRVFHVVNDV